MKVNIHTWIVVAVALALIVAALPLLSACASPQAKPGQVLKIGMMNPATGPGSLPSAYMWRVGAAAPSSRRRMRGSGIVSRAWTPAPRLGLYRREVSPVRWCMYGQSSVVSAAGDAASNYAPMPPRLQAGRNRRNRRRS